MTYKNMIIEGDLQIRSDKSTYNDASVHYLARKNYIEWILSSDLNIEENIFCSLGDFFELSHPTPRDMKLAIYYLSNLKCKRKIIIAGNHDYDRYRNSYSIDPLAEIPGVELIKKPIDLVIEGVSFKILPFFYDYIFSDLESMKKEYESLSGTYDFILTHVSDETQNFGGTEGINLSNLKGERLQGHIHTGGKGYVESPLPNKTSEVLKERNLRVLNLETKEVLKRKIPQFLEYITVVYPEKITKSFSESLINLTITEAPDKTLALDHYKKEYPDAFIKEVRKKVLKEIPKEGISSKKVRPIKELWDSFSTENKVDKEVSTLVLEKIGKVSA